MIELYFSLEIVLFVQLLERPDKTHENFYDVYVDIGWFKSRTFSIGVRSLRAEYRNEHFDEKPVHLFCDSVTFKFFKSARMDIPPTQEIKNPEKQRNVSGGGRLVDHTVFERIIAHENIFAAWNEFLRGKRRRPDVQAFAYRAEDHLFELHEQLVRGIWRHGGYHAFTVCDPKPRQIHKASVTDRIVHHAVVRVLQPIFERSFIFDSWSCRKEKGVFHSVQRCISLLRAVSEYNRKPVWALHGDIRGYFASIDHDILLRLIARRISDHRALDLLRQIVSSYRFGLPLGNLTSQLFANVYLNGFDHFVTERLGVQGYLRYSDDFLLIDESAKRLASSVAAIEQYLRARLRLALHPNKLTIRPFSHGIDWLGCMLFPDRVMLRATTRRRLLRRIRESCNGYLNGELSRGSFRSVFTSYTGLIRHTGNGSERDELAEWWRLLS